MSEEVWRTIRGFRNRYEVSSHGRVRSLRRVVLVKTRSGKFGKRVIRARVLKLVSDGPYLCVSLYKNGFTKAAVHRLVAEAFIPNPDNKPEVNHKDNDGTNNHVDNLEWVTPKENAEHAISIGRVGGAKGEQHGHAKLTPGLVRKIRWAYFSTPLSQSKIAKKFRINQSTVSRLVSGKRWRHLTEKEK